MFYTTIVLIHACCATIGLLSGALAMIFRKGSGLHRVAGTFFFVAMAGMAGSGAFIATFLKPNHGNVIGGTLTLYLVVTGWVAGRRREREAGMFDYSALAFVTAIVAAAATWGIQARMSGGVNDGYPATLYFIFGSIALLLAVSDVRMLVHGGVSGAQRIGRHLWRMSFALMFATFSLFPGQGKLFPMWLRKSSLSYIPHVLLVGSTLWWLARISRRKRAERQQVATAQPSEAMAIETAA